MPMEFCSGCCGGLPCDVCHCRIQQWAL
jgi:hypothetical protein